MVRRRTQKRNRRRRNRRNRRSRRRTRRRRQRGGKQNDLLSSSQIPTAADFISSLQIPTVAELGCGAGYTGGAEKYITRAKDRLKFFKRNDLFTDLVFDEKMENDIEHRWWTAEAAACQPDDGLSAEESLKKFKNKKNLYSWTIKKISARRWGEVDEISNLAIFLLSNRSSYINGQIISIDGGWTS